MKLETNKTYHGFKLTEERRIDEINSIQRIFFHDKSGARLLSLENDDDNKVFAIGFRTPPENSTGLPHILEHSVLCGSRKFPSKEPFVDLLKGSLNTFLNAMTYADKTLYPVASKNDKDFYNLMDVYLDAVLYPNIYKYPEIFMQEGWHYELEDEKAELTYKGVVYNEMKGAFSSPEETLFRRIQESLFPDTSYSKESGGDPEVIPELSLEEFLNFHKRYYHPSNSYIYIYGNGDVMEQLKFIDESYLKDFDRIDIDSKIKVQRAFENQREVTVEYPISEDEDEKDNTFLSLNFAAGRATNPEIYLGLEILEYMLLETPAAPLKKALLEVGLGKDVLGRIDNGILQPIFSVIVKNSNEDKKEEFQKVVFDTLEKLVQDGLDKKLVEASINIIEFRMREADFHGFPKGLFYYIKSMESWLYDSQPGLHLEFDPTLEKVKAALTTDYFEDIIREYLLNNTHRSLLVVKPKKGLGEQKAEEVRKKLRDHKQSLNMEEIRQIIENTEKLRIRQTTPDSPEALESIPMVSLEDISPKSEVLPLVKKEYSDIKVLAHPMFTNGIAYVNVLFDAGVVDQELLPYIGLLSGVMGRVSTGKHSYGELSNEINIHTGGIDFSVEAYGDSKDPDKYCPKFVVKSKALIDKLPELFEILGEIIGSTRFDEGRRLKEIIREMKSRLEMVIYGRGHIVAGNHLLSYFSPVGKYVEITKGLDFYKFIAGLEKNLDSNIDEISKNLKKLSEMIFNKKGLIISFTAAEDDYKSFEKSVDKLMDHIGNRELKIADYKFELGARNEGLLTQANVQYVAKGYNFKKLGYSYSGEMEVLKTIIGLDYLWNKVRVQGGAYGAFGRFDRNGSMFAASYRDPNLRETLGVYDGMEGYIRSFEASQREMTKYIIGTISEVDFPLTPSMKGERATANYISGLTQEDIQRQRDEILGTTQEDIIKFADLARDVMKQDYICVLGNEAKIKENKDIFGKLVNVFE